MLQDIPPPLLRPVIIELRYEKKEQFDAAVKLYEGLLSKKVEEPYLPESKIRAFRIGYANERKYRDMLLRLTYPLDGLSADSSHTVLYWKVARANQDKLKQLYDSLQTQLSLVPLEAPGPYEMNGTTSELVARSVLKDKASGALLGLTINPPVPTIALAEAENNKSRSLLEQIKAHLLGLLGLLLVPVVGFSTFWLGKWRGIKQERLRASDL